MPQKPFYQRKNGVRSGNQWEKNVYDGISEHLKSTKKGGYVHHLNKLAINSRISVPQVIDILVDNAGGLYFGIECKSSQKASIRFSSAFRHNGKSGQFEEETDFLNKSGRIGIVALSMRETDSPDGSFRYSSYLIPWNAVTTAYTHEITTELLDDWAAPHKKRNALIYKIPTDDGTVHLPSDTNVFRKLEEMASYKLVWSK